MSEIISEFSGDYFFLSNFYPCKLRINGTEFSSVEHYFQAMKCLDFFEYEKIRLLPTAKEARQMGRRINLRPDWNTIRDSVMEYGILVKFQIPILQNLLLTTQDKELVENNTWGDVYWGICNGKGENKLGKILMKTRTYFQSIVNTYHQANIDPNLRFDPNDLK